MLGSSNSNNVSISCLAIIPITPFTNDVDTSEPALMLVQVAKSIGMQVVHNYKKRRNANNTIIVSVPWQWKYTILALKH